MALRVSCMGTRSAKLTWGQNLNQPRAGPISFNHNMRRFPAIRSVTCLSNGGNSVYHSMHVVAERNMSGGLYHQSGWTWAKNLSDVESQGETGTRPEDSYNRRAEWADLPTVARHRLVGQLLYTLPFSPGKPMLNGVRGITRALLADRTLSTTLVSRGGLCFTPSFSGCDISNTNTVGGRPDRSGKGALPSGERTIGLWSDAAAFRVPGDLNGNGRPDVPVGRFGNSAANVVVGPGAWARSGFRDVLEYFGLPQVAAAVGGRASTLAERRTG